MRKVLFWTLLIFMLLLPCAANAENLLVNSDFSELDEDGMPVGWYADAWKMDRTRFAAETLEDGTTCVTITNADYNDARFVQDVSVKENTVYKFTCRIRAEGADPIDRIGACISFLDTHVYSEALYDTAGEWQTVTFYGRTDVGQNTLMVAARLGGYSFDNIGRACFTDFTMEEADEEELAASGFFVVSLATNSPSRQSFGDFSFEDFGSAEPMPVRNTETHIAITLFTLILFLYLIRSFSSAPVSPLAGTKSRSGPVVFALLMLLGLIVRIYLALRFRGYAVDVTNFMAWGNSFFSAGPAFYTQAGLHDYPPLYMLILGLSDLVRILLGVPYNSDVHALLIKLTPIYSDLAFAALVYALFRKEAGEKWALTLSCLVLLNPAYMINSAAWGQVDSVLALAIVLVVYLAMRGNWLYALPMFAVSMLLKPQALLFGPLGLFALGLDAYKNRKDLSKLLKMLFGVLFAFAVLYFCAFPFAVYEATQAGKGFFGAILSPIGWLLNLYTDTTSGYSYITVNALNLYQLFDLNWVDTLSAPGVYKLSWLLMIAAYVYTALLMFFSKSVRSLPLAGAVLIAQIFSFGPMMHERYLFPVLALLLLAFWEHRDRHLLFVLIAFTLTQYLNQALVLQCGMSQQYPSMGHLSSEEALLNKLISHVNLFFTCYLSVVVFRILVLKKISPFKCAGESQKNAPAPRIRTSDYRLHLTSRDYVLMTAVTVLYAAFAFTNLGTSKAPETFYRNADYKEQVVFDLGDTQTFRMTYYGGISSTPFTVAFSNDGETWTEENYAQYGEGEIFRWLWFTPKTYSAGAYKNAVARIRDDDALQNDAYVNYATLYDAYPLQTARYIRITYMGFDLPLHEVAFWDVENEVLYEIKNVYGTEKDAEYTLLTDEQDTVPFTPSYYNGTYFDEIYHARTAYEFIHELPVLEWSHPHLGKIFIMLGIKIFGMNPFGWRFMGTLFGALMLPVMYLLVKQLTKNTGAATFGMLFLAFDSMHFTQSRIATVDTYAVFFIMLMYLFMFRYLQMNLHKEPLQQTFVPLGLSGLFFGFACASKWIGIYAGAGLAVLFFASLAIRFREYRDIRKNLRPSGNRKRKNPDPEADALVRLFPVKLISTLLFCVVMFILVPVLIYYLCYYWHFAPTNEFNPESVWELQKQMFHYHDGLGGDTHSFRSPWYEWPLIERPMWYYSADTAYTGMGVVSSISCMGNPVVWWTGFIAILLVILLPAIMKKADKNHIVIAVSFASQFLPWMLISRSTFIYHYFASVPFIILATAYLLDTLRKKDRYAFITASGTLTILALILFVMFYPLESGYPCSYGYALRLRWFDWYNFALQ